MAGETALYYTVQLSDLYVMRNEKSPYEYDMDATYFQRASMLQRSENIGWAFSYAQSFLEDDEDREDSRSKMAWGYLTKDLGESALRLKLDYGRLAGTASYKVGTTVTEHAINNKYLGVGFHLMHPTGRYYGMEYTHYKIPTWISKDHSKTQGVFDEDFKLNQLQGVLGYDAVAGGLSDKRFSRYFSGMVGFGLAVAQFSDEVKRSLNSGGDTLLFSPSMTVEGEFGLAWNVLNRSVKGQLLAGFRVRWHSNYMGKNSDHGLSYDRMHDFFYGPFVGAALSF